MRATGQRFAFILATDGDTIQDTTFDDHWLGAKSAGILRGAIHRFRPNADPIIQAERFLAVIQANGDIGELPPVLDLEVHDEKSAEEIIPKVKIWLDLVEASFGRKPIIYSGEYFLQDYFSEQAVPPQRGQRIIHSGWHSIPTSTPLDCSLFCRVAGSNGHSGNIQRKGL